VHHIKLGLFLFPILLFGQISNNTVTVTASQSATVAPDLVVFWVAVGSGFDQSLNDVVAAVSGLGLTAANLVGVNVQPQPLAVDPPGGAGGVLPGLAVLPSPLQWQFQLIVPFAKMKDTTAALAALQQSLGQNNSSLTLTYQVSGAQFSAQSPDCNLANLVSQARTMAQQITTPAGMTPGAIVGLNGSTSANTPAVCSLTVRFALGMMFAQGPNAITITATRLNPTAPDQATVYLAVNSPPSAVLDDITGALTKAGITGVTFVGVTSTTVYSNNLPQTSLNWTFTETAPLATLNKTLQQLEAVPRTLTGIMSLNVSVPNVSASHPPACPQSDLVNDAHTMAQKVASAAGGSAGPILSMAEGASAAAPAGVAFAGSFLLGAVTTSVISTAPPPTCSLTVQYQLM
jgi:hypothetical protein